MSEVKDDAVPFDVPEEKESEDEEEKEKAKETEKPKKKPEKKAKNKKKHFFSDSSEESDSDDDFFKRAQNSGNSILINKGKNIHIGDSFMFTQVNTEMSNFNISSNTTRSKPTTQFAETLKKDLPKNISDSVREIDPEDMHFVAEHISSDWKKLARFLPPKGNAFSNGQLKAFEENNPRNIQEAIYQMLNDWKERFPEEATISNLAKTLNRIDKYEIAINLTP